ncbi:cupin domain-containing protein [Afifella aestuarii]|uniref:cupin domain-containing protein n=1 Tax=Afifella aestuarii TaxID=1909496 RepID=UPI000FE2A254|nr:cupin domain-containing protein [Afifella aestuarii]
MSTATDTYHLFGNLVRFLARSPETGGAYCLVETLSAPGAGAPPNRHPGDDEAFYVVEGTFEFMLDGKTFTAGPGDFVKVPTGAAHAFKNVGKEPARLLVINTPGLVHEGFYTQAGDAVPSRTREFPPFQAPDIPALKAIAERNGMEILLPDGPQGEAA